jgi:hypothetical protein
MWTARSYRLDRAKSIAWWQAQASIYWRWFEKWLCVQYFDGGDAWFTPLAKIVVDQTAFAASWNTLYYFMLGKQLTLCSDHRQSLRHET